MALGTMRLPALLLLVRDMPVAVAGGTNILVSTLSALTGSYRHWRDRRVDPTVVVVMGIPSVVGAFVGGLFAEAVPEKLLLGLAGALVLWQGLEFVMRTRRLARATVPGAAPQPTRLPIGLHRGAVEAGIGFGIGLLGSAVGLILGSIRLPALVRILKMDIRTAAGTNLVIGFLMGAFGFLGHGVRKDFDLPLLLVMGATGMVGTYYGARLTGKVSLRSLVLVTGVVLISVGALMVVDVLARSVR